MARIFGEGSGKGVDAQPHHLEINDAGAVKLPEGIDASSCELTRDGQDLVLTAPDGQVFVVENYFTMADAPVIISDSGALLSPALVMSFIKPAAGDVQVATAEQANDASPVGEVTEVSGEATVTHSDGTKEKITAGTQIFEGDIVETDAKGAVNIKFADDSTFAVSENARLAVDDFSFNAADQSGTTGVSILRGVFMFTSGLIGRENPDAVSIETPVGSIGIRGTIIGGSIQQNGQTTISVIEGAIVVRNGTGEQILSQQFETVTLTAFSQPIINIGTMNAGQMTQTYGAVRPVSPTLFTSIDDTTRDSGDNNAPQNTAPEQHQQTQPETQPQSTAPEAPQAPVQQSAVITETTIFQTLTTGSNIDNSLGAPPTPVAPAPINAAPLPVTTAPPSNTPPPVTVPPVLDSGDHRAPSSVTFVSGGSYAENNAVGAEVGRVQMSDTTMKFPVKYELINNTGPFTIDADGRIFVTARGNYEVDPNSYTFDVRVTRTDTSQTTDTQHLTINMTNVDEAPTFGSVGASVAEGSFVVLTASMIGATDPDGDTAHLTYTVTGQNKGSILVNNTAASTFTQAQLEAGLVKFAHNGDEPGSGTVNFSIRATDATSHASNEVTVAVTVGATNDSPTVQANSGGTIAENSNTTITSTMLNYTDSDNTASEIVYTVTGASHGTVMLNAVSTTTFTQADINAGIVHFIHDTGESTSADIQYSVSDGNATVSGQTLSFTVTNVNDTPVLMSQTHPTLAEDGTLGLTASMLAYADDDLADTPENLIYTLTEQTHGVVQSFNGSWANVGINGNFSQADINAGHIRFVHSGDEQNDASFSYSLTDGHIANPITGTFDIDITPVNDAAQAPSLSSTASLAERASTGSPAAAISTITISDGENPASNPDYAFTVQRYNGTSWVDDNRFEVFDNSGLWQLRAKANAGFDHETEGSIQLQVTLTDGTHTPVVSGTLTLSITDVNEAATSFSLNNNVDYQAGTGIDAFVQGKHSGSVIGILNALDVDATPSYHPDHNNYRISGLTVLTGSLGGLTADDFQVITRTHDGKTEQVLKLRDGLAHTFGPNDKFQFTIELDADQDGLYNGAADLQQTIILSGRNDTLILELVDGSNGFQIHNDARTGTTPGAYFANSMLVGDYNNDGRADLVFGAPRAVNSQTEAAGGFYGITNTNGLITDAADGNINLTTALAGGAATSFFHELTTGSDDAGAFYGAHIALMRNFSGNTVSLATVNPNNGVVEIYQNGSTAGVITINNIPHNGSNTFDKLVLASVGDINGDGFGDLLIGSQTAGNYAGTVGIMLGNPSQTSTINFQTQASAILNGGATGDLFGSQIAALGDVDGDGRMDFAVSSYNADTGGSAETGQGRVTVYFGSNNVSTLTANKFTINNVSTDDQGHFGYQIAGAGDFNGDGRGDLLIQGHHSVTLVYGEAAGQRGTTVSMDQLNTGAFHGVTFNATGLSANDKIGGAISSAGDFNGDGYDDVVIDYAKAVGGGLFEHTLFVVYGSNAGTTAYDLDALRTNESAAFKIRMLNPTGETLTLTAAGDFNGDGFDDFLVGDPTHSNNHDGVQDGAATMIYGGNYDGVVAYSGASATADTITKVFIGDAGNNVVNANTQTDVSFRAGAGDDTMIISNQASVRNFEGGSGTDTLKLFFSGEESTATADLINLRGLSLHANGVEVIQFDSSSKLDTLQLDIRDILTMANGNADHRLFINATDAADGSNHLSLFDGSTLVSNLATAADTSLRFSKDADGVAGQDFIVTGGTTYYVYTHATTGAQLLVDSRVGGADQLVV